MSKLSKVDKVLNKYLLKAVNKDIVSRINDTALLREDLSLDSLRLVSILSSACNDLGINVIDISDEELEGINSVGDFKRVLKSKFEAGDRISFF